MKEFPKGINKLKELRVLDLKNIRTKAGVTNLPEEVFQLKNLEILSLGDLPLQQLSASIDKLKKLWKIYLLSMPMKSLPATIGRLKKLSDLCIRWVDLETLPEEIGEFTALEELILEGTKIQHLPTNLNKWKKLRSIRLGDNQLEVFPLELCYCKKLTRIDVQSNQLKNLPLAIAKMQNLEWFNGANNPLTAFPPFILDADLTQLEWKFDAGLHNEVDLKSLINRSDYRDLTEELRRYYFYLHCNLVEFMKTIPASGLRAAFNASFKTVKTRAVEYATQDNLETLKEGNVVLVNTKLNQKKTVLKEKLSPLGIKVVNKMSPEVTHVLVSFSNNTKLELLPKDINWKWITEAQLTTYINEKMPSYLVADSQAAVEEGTSMIAKVSELVMSGQEDNWELAVELVKGGGLPVELFTDLFIINKLTENAALRKETKKILLENIQETHLVQIIQSRKRLQFSSSQGLKWHENMQNRILEWTTDTPIDRVRLAYACYQKMEVGQGLILNEGASIWSKKVIEQNILKHNGFFELWTSDSLLQLFTTLKGISCYIYGKKSLNYVNVPQDRKSPFFIPASIANLKELEKLELRFVRMEEIPLAALTQLKKLKEVVLYTDRDVDLQPWKDVVPDCEFGWW